MHLKKQFGLEIFINLSAPVLIAVLMQLPEKESLLLIAGSFLIDIDHFFYYLLSKNPKNIKSAVAFFKYEFKNHTPHFYIFHTFETLFVLITTSYLMQSDLLYLFLGFLINFTIDIVTYLYIYKSTKPWGKYFSLTLSALV